MQFERVFRELTLPARRCAADCSWTTRPIAIIFRSFRRLPSATDERCPCCTPPRRGPVKPKFASILILLAAIGGGWYFLQHFNLEGLSGLSLAAHHAHERHGVLQCPARAAQRRHRAHRVVQHSSLRREQVAEAARDGKAGDDRPQLRHRRHSGNPHPRQRHPSAVRRHDQRHGPALRFRHRPAAGAQRRAPSNTRTSSIRKAWKSIGGSFTRWKIPTICLHREPLVGWFRVRGPDASQAFTFTLVNIHTDPDEVATE